MSSRLNWPDLCVRRRVWTLVSVWLSLVLLAGPANSWAHGQGERLDSAERQRLRWELRQRAIEERMRAQGAVPPVGGSQPGHPQTGGYPNLGGYPYQQAYPRHGYPYQGAPVPQGAYPMPRLSPEERQQLRRQLREGRERGRDSSH